MDLRSGSKDLTVRSIILMRLLHGTLLFSGKPPKRPPDSDLVIKISKHDAPRIDPRGMGALEDLETMPGVLGRLKEEGEIIPTSSLPTITSDLALRKEKQRDDSNLPVCKFGIGDVKEGSNDMKNDLYHRSSTLSLWRIDPYWKSQLLVDYSKDIFTCMILDDQLQEEGYSVRDEVIYYHGRIFLSRASKLKEKLLHVAHQDFLFNHTYSMRAYNTIREGYTWEGFEEEIYQNLRRFMDSVEI